MDITASRPLALLATLALAAGLAGCNRNNTATDAPAGRTDPAPATSTAPMATPAPPDMPASPASMPASPVGP
jgi:hypothetical protein